MGIVEQAYLDPSSNIQSAQVKKEESGKPNKGERVYRLRLDFHRAIRGFLGNVDSHPMGYDGPELNESSLVTVPELDAYQTETFNDILNYMVGDSSVDLEEDVVAFLVSKGLMQVDDRGQGEISGGGYEFMLLGERGRIWGLAREYLRGLEGEKLKGAVLMLMVMATADLGRGCGIIKIPKISLQHMPQFKKLGLVYLQKGSRVWYPTRAAVEMGRGGEEGR